MIASRSGLCIQNLQSDDQPEALRQRHQSHDRRETDDAVHIPAHRLRRDPDLVIGDGHDRNIIQQRQRDDHDGRQRLKAENDARQHDDEHDVDRHGDAIIDVTRDPLEDLPRFDDGVDDGRQSGRGQDQRGGAAGGVGRAADGHAAIGLFQRRSVVDAVAGHRHDMAALLQRLDDLELVLREYASKSVRLFDGAGRVDGDVIGVAEDSPNTSDATSRCSPRPSWRAISLPMATSSPVTIFTDRPSFSASAIVCLASGRGGSISDKMPSSFQLLPSSSERDDAERAIAVRGEFGDLIVILLGRGRRPVGTSPRSPVARLWRNVACVRPAP